MPRAAARELRRIDAVFGLIAWSLGGGLVISGILDYPAIRTLGGSALSWLMYFMHVSQILLVAVLIIVISLLTGRFGYVFATLASLATFVSIANLQKMQTLGVPILAEDFKFLDDPKIFMSTVGITPYLKLATVLLFVWAIGYFLNRKLSWIGEGLQFSKSSVRVVRIACLAVIVTVALGSATFHHRHSPIRNFFEATGASWAPWDPTANFVRNGYVGTFLFSLPLEPMEMPEGYEKSSVEATVARHVGTSPGGQASRGSLADWNIVVVLSESFADPTKLEGAKFSRNPMANFEELQSTFAGGELQAVAYGTGTSTMEFSVLTGQSLALLNPQVISPYQSYVSDYDSYPSFVGWWKAQGNRAIAVHGWRSSLYDRESVYPALGFDEFFDIDDLEGQAGAYQDEGQRFVSDGVHYDRVLAEIQASETPLLSHIVTIQNHVPFETQFDNLIEVRAKDQENVEALSSWATGIESSSDQLSLFLEQLEELDEPTAVVYFGDHFPSVETKPSSNLDLRSSAARTPYLLWDNQGLIAGQDTDLPNVLSPASLLPAVAATLNLEGPAMFGLLNKVQHEVGTIMRQGIVTDEGLVVTLMDLTPSARALVEDYRLIQYDLAAGGRYSAEDLWGDNWN